MKAIVEFAFVVATISLSSCVALAAIMNVEDKAALTPADSPSNPAQAKPDLEKQKSQADQQARPEIEQQRQQAEQQAQKTLDKDAIAAIDQTEQAISAIANNKTDEALTAIEAATGKINILLARNPSNALIPVDLEVHVIDTAPRDRGAVIELAQHASKAVDDMDFPDARILLHALMSEIRIRTYNLPLATYPIALQEAARLLDQKKNKEASDVLLTALNTLVAADRVMPIPLLVARELINQAQTQGPKDKNAAQSLLERAQAELQRAKDLGYASHDPEYKNLSDQISNVQKQLRSNENTSSVFAQLKQRWDAFVKRISERERH